MVGEDEKKLVKALSKGNHDAFKLLYSRYRARIYYFIYSTLRSADQAEEIFQSVFLKIWENREQLKVELSFNNYVYKIARNLMYAHFRKLAYDKLLGDYLNSSQIKSDDSVESSLIEGDLSDYIRRLIGQLPERRREIFMLHRMGNMTYEQVAKKLNITENTVHTQISKALTFLRTKLSDELHVGGAAMLFIGLLLG